MDDSGARRPAEPPQFDWPPDSLSVEPFPSASDSPTRRPLLELFPPEPPVKRPAASRAPQRPAPKPQQPARLESRPHRLAAYEAFYGLAEAPFALSTDPRFFYHSTPHDAVAQQLLSAIREHAGLVVVVGAMGTGKTTLCRTVIEQLDRRTLTSFVADPFVSAEDLLKTILADFGVMSRDELARGPFATREELSTALHSFIESLAPLDAAAVVIIDEAQNIPKDVMEQLRALVEAAHGSPRLQVVLVGQPALTALLRRPEHRALEDRVSVRCTLSTLPPDEIGSYLTHRLSVAGAATAVVFERPALMRMFQLSQGVPRVVNLLGDRALQRAFERSSKLVDEHAIEGAAADLDLGDRPSLTQDVAPKLLTIVALALSVVVGGAIAAWVFRDTVARVLKGW